jgi:nitrogen regulatory protein P-II 1
VSFLPKVTIEVVVPTNLVDSVIDAIMKSARTGQIGDGKIFMRSASESGLNEAAIAARVARSCD